MLRFVSARAPARALAACGLLVLAGCAGYSQGIRQVESFAVAGQPRQALTALEAVGLDDDDRALYQLNRGMLLREAGEYRASIAAFEQAKRIMEELEAASVTETASSLSISERWADYAGKPYERLLVHVYQALNHIDLGQLEQARVEALQIDLLLRRLYPGERHLPQGGDAFGLYLSGLIFEAVNEPDAALVAYRQALEAYAGTGGSVPGDLQQRLLRLTAKLGLAGEHRSFVARFGQGPEVDVSGTGQVVAIVSAGLVPRRIAVESLSQDPQTGRMYRISLPDLVPRPTRVAEVVLESGGDSAQGETVERVSVAVRQTLQAELPGLTLRAIARMVVKEVAANEVAQEHGSGAAGLVNLLGVLVEQADTRQWSLLPDRIYLASLRLPPGSHAVALKLYDRQGSTITTQQYDSVQVTAGGLRLLTFRTYK